MNGQDRNAQIDPVIRLLAGFMLCVFFLRALIPTGFMPDAGALAEGRLELVICTSSGEKTVQTVAFGSPDGGEPETWAGADCPYHLSLSQAFVAPALPVLPVVFAARAAHGFIDAANFLLPPALGPPLGPRAPPENLA